MKTNNSLAIAKNSMQIATLVLGLAMGSYSFAQSLHTRIFEAQTAIAKQNWTDAEGILSQLNQANPNNPYVLYELAQVYENTNRMDAAKKIYQDFSKMPESKQREYIIVVRSANGVQPVSLASLTPSGIDRITAKQATAAATVAQVPAKPVIVAQAAASGANDALKNMDASVLASVQTWVKAWTNKDMAAYFASFTKDFQGEKKSVAAWRKFRTDNITSKKSIALDLTSVQVTALSATKAQVSFIQNYTSDSFKDVTNKALTMTKSGNGWVIEAMTTPSAAEFAKMNAKQAPTTAMAQASEAPAKAPAVDAKGIDGAITAATQNWVKAWTSKDMAAYYASYVKDFQGEKKSAAAWKKFRNDNITSKKSISLDLSDVQIAATSATQAQVTFKQNYSSDTYKEVSTKTLGMAKVGDAWLINKETTK
jgi:Tetratricopeptide repeat